MVVGRLFPCREREDRRTPRGARSPRTDAPARCGSWRGWSRGLARSITERSNVRPGWVYRTYTPRRPVSTELSRRARRAPEGSQSMEHHTNDDVANMAWKANLIDRIYASRDAVEIANKAILCRYVEATNVGDLDELDELVVEDFVEHEPVPGQPQGREGLKWAYRQFLDPFPDVQFIFDDVIAEGDLVVGRGVISATHTGPFFG